MYMYKIGNIKIKSGNINELKELSKELTEISKESGTDLSKPLNDVCFSIDVDYQKYYDLVDENIDINIYV